MDRIEDRERMARFLASQDAPTLMQALIELAEDHAPVYQRLKRLIVKDDPLALKAQFMQQVQKWRTEARWVRYQDAAALGHELDVWVTQVQREMLPRFPCDAMALFAAFLELDQVVLERVDDDGGYVGGAFEIACQLWLASATAAGLSAAEVADGALALLSEDHYGVRAALGRAIVR